MMGGVTGNAPAAGNPEQQGYETRTMSPELAFHRLIGTALKPTHRKLLKWQSRAAWIAAIDAAEKLDRTRPRTEARTLLNEVQREQAAVKNIEAEIAGADGNSRIANTLVALRGIEIAMSRVLAT
ncbi:MAG: hypothetical protein ABI377_06000 [Devosia sp.]